MKKLMTVLFCAGMALFGRVSYAQQLEYQFTFIGDVNSDNSAAELVTGDLFGLQNNATGLPTSVVVTVAPSEVQVTTPYTFSSSAVAGESGSGFTVTNGVVTAGSFFIASGTTNGSLNLSLNDGLNLLGTLNGTGGYTNYTFNDAGFAGAIYTLVPEPSPCWLLLVGAGLIWIVRRVSAKRNEPGEAPLELGR